MTRLLPLILSLWLFTGCQSPNLDHARAPADQAAAGTSDLSWAEAKARGSRVTRPRYILNVKLNETEKTFSGASEIRFNLNDPSKPLRVDFFEGQVAKMQLNGKPLAPEAKKPYWIELPPERLVNGENSLTVEYTQEYSTQGQGLHRAVDPETKQVFLYSQFETFDANRFMPCFDQPDMRAALTMTVEAPEKWEVVTATRETKITRDARAKTRTWSFPQTPEISTYLFSLHAGPYKVWTDKFEDIPLRLFARPSQAKYLRAKEFFTYTKKGLKFFNAYFDFKYPFKKYDQLVVPEFNAGAMENVAAVTFSERFLWRSEPTRQQLQGLSSVILHEMAHMWFGDIVTMKWWNDLWLNESFATYMAALANTESNDFPEEWQDFFASDKAWAYWEDALVTTHPIEAPVNTVKEAFATFDGITYGKGAAVLKQLNAYVTPQAFRAGIRKYIQRYAYKNADLNDFIAALQGETKRDLSLWAERWLRQSGTDKIAARWSCAGDRLTAVELIVTPTPGAKFRPQTVNVGLFEEKNGGLAKPVSVRADL
ncbi:MAG TPA: M1 family aminopeptidase, partial [Bdellovibrionales bacterium]|nr:M1 family aminopeptidase [Bdellovibrionales bacterium]